MTSRLRQPRARCRAPRGPAQPRRVMSCGDGSALVLWAAQAHATTFSQPLAGLLPAPRAWDVGAPEREHIGAMLAQWPMPRGWADKPTPRTYPPERPPTEAPRLRQCGVAGDLRAALRDPNVPDRKSKVRSAA